MKKVLLSFVLCLIPGFMSMISYSMSHTDPKVIEKATNELEKTLNDLLHYPANSRTYKDNLLKKIENLVHQGADVKKIKYISSKLHQAVKGNYFTIVKILLEAGIAANSNVDGKTPLAHTKDQLDEKKYDIIFLLINHGADPNVSVDDRGQTILMLSSAWNRPEVIRFLLEKNVPLNTRDKDGETALMYAIEGGHTNIVKMLLDAGADPDVLDNGGSTALVRALTKRNNKEIYNQAKLLLEAGANPEIKDKIFKNAYDYAIGEGQILELLREYRKKKLN